MLCPQLVGFKKMADFCRHPGSYSDVQRNRLVLVGFQKDRESAREFGASVVAADIHRLDTAKLRELIANARC